MTPDYEKRVGGWGHLIGDGTCALPCTTWCVSDLCSTTTEGGAWYVAVTTIRLCRRMLENVPSFLAGVSLEDAKAAEAVVLAELSQEGSKVSVGRAPTSCTPCHDTCVA